MDDKEQKTGETFNEMKKKKKNRKRKKQSFFDREQRGNFPNGKEEHRYFFWKSAN